MKPPAGVHNEALWIKHCTKIRARALDFIKGRIDIFTAASALQLLAMQTRAEDDDDLLTFRQIYSDMGSLPIGPVRQYWAAHALERVDPKIRAIEKRWRHRAQAAAEGLLKRYAWSLEARAALRRAGGSARIV
jgi:hypothetical protein